LAKSTAVLIPHETVNDEFVTLVAWLVTNEEQVEEGQAIASVESSKAVMDIHAPVAGIVQTLLKPGDEISVGGTLCHIWDNSASGDSSEDVGVPAGEEVMGGLPSQNPVLSKAWIREPEGRNLGWTESPVSNLGTDRSNEGQVSYSSSNGETQLKGSRFSRKAAELMNHLQLSPGLFAGRGLVRAGDVLEQRGTGSPRLSAPRRSATNDRLERAGSLKTMQVPVRTEELPKRKRSEIVHLSWARENSLTSAVSVLVPTHGLRAAASLHPEMNGNATAILIYEAARLLRKYPRLNGFYSNGNVNLYQEVNVGFVVDAGHGLKVLVIRNADTKGIPDIAREMQDLIAQYLNDEIPAASLAGGTFTVSDLSGEDVFLFYPLLNQRQGATLGVGGEFFPPGSSQGMFNMVLSFDHQLSEGREAAKFLNDLRQRLKGYEEALRPSKTSGESNTEPYCSKCLKPLGELREWNSFLLLALQADGSTRNVCSICVQGF
jgi:pyruvate/2-oxoglutarate dehydrogenase complex dihydrolipoamide acyltransferase (E2) component